MYARRYDDGPRIRPVSLGVALAINGGLITALLFAAPELIRVPIDEPLTVTSIPLPTPEPIVTPEPAKPRITATRTRERVDVSRTTALTPPHETNVMTPGPMLPVDPGPLTLVEPMPEATALTPVFVAAGIDPRYARDFQPGYPDIARDAGLTGVVRLRVLIGIDGRIRQVQRISGADVLWRAASRHALARWRFTPATRGGVPEESWKVMSVRFELN